MSRTELRHKEKGIVPRDKATSKTDEAGFRAVNEDVGRGEVMTAMWAGGIISGPGPKAVGVIGMEGVSRDELETRGLEISRSSDEAPQCEVREGASRGLGKDWVGRVRL